MSICSADRVIFLSITSVAPPNFCSLYLYPFLLLSVRSPASFDHLPVLCRFPGIFDLPILSWSVGHVPRSADLDHPSMLPLLSFSRLSACRCIKPNSNKLSSLAHPYDPSSLFSSSSLVLLFLSALFSSDIYVLHTVLQTRTLSAAIRYLPATLIRCLPTASICSSYQSECSTETQTHPQILTSPSLVRDIQTPHNNPPTTTSDETYAPSALFLDPRLIPIRHPSRAQDPE